MQLKHIIFALIAFSAISCNKFLDTPTSKTSSLPPTTVEQLEAVLNGYTQFYSEGDQISIYASDNFDLSIDTYKEKNNVYSIHVPKFALWDTESIQDHDRHYWSSEWNKIFIANMVLTNLSKVTGGTEAQKAALKSECHFIIAYSYLKLAEAYTLPYTEKTKDEMGLPIKKGVSFDEDLTRVSLSETYKFIEENLTEALKLTNKMGVANNKNRSWRASKGAVNAFAARYWLIRGNYESALSYANIALREHSQLVDYNVDMRYSDIISEYDINGKKERVWFPYTHDGNTSDMLEWREHYYFRMLYLSSWWYMPSPALIDSYNKEYDLRYKYHIVENYSYDRNLRTKEIPGYVFFYKDKIPSGPTVAEMLLIKAECEARANKVSEAMITVNKLRAVRMDNTAPLSVINLTATTKEQAVAEILKERRREMPYTARWSDMRRLNHNSDSFDDIVVSKKFYPYSVSTILGSETPIDYVLENGSRKYASPIPRVDIDATLGVMKQNKY